MASLAIFGNFRIDSEERLQRMKDSLLSFEEINATKWVINVRGAYKKEALDFLHAHLGNRLVAYQLESAEGWFYDSHIMLQDLNAEFVLYWLEDHINQVSDISLYDAIINEMEMSSVEYLKISFFWIWERYELIPKNEMSNICWFDLDETTFPLLQKKAPGTYIISCNGIFNITLFTRLISDDDEMQAIKWPKETPFDFEKSSSDVHWLPIRTALPKQELFACIDDDSLAPGSSLVARGLYPARQIRRAMGTPGQIRPIRYPNLSTHQSNKKTGMLDSLRSKIVAAIKVLLQR